MMNTINYDSILNPTCIVQYELGNLKNFIYLVVCRKTKDCFLVDTQTPLSKITQEIKKNGLRLQGLLLTHSHHDHVAGLSELMSEYPSLPIFIHPLETHRITKKTPQFTKNFVLLKDQQVLQLGLLSIKILHTPGHTAGECCFYIEENRSRYLLSGDTLFIRDCGRTDLDTGNNTQMFESLQKLKKLEENTLIFPGHHYVQELHSTLKEELIHNAPLKCKTVEELSKLP